VLAFPGDEASRVGDVAISVERALAQSRDGAAEMRLLAVHGLLHCLGHDHADRGPAARMTELTRMLLPGADVPELEAAGV
jgi:rRNA maturation RNase YbeY